MRHVSLGNGGAGYERFVQKVVICVRVVDGLGCVGEANFGCLWAEHSSGGDAVADRVWQVELFLTVLQMSI